MMSDQDWPNEVSECHLGSKDCLACLQACNFSDFNPQKIAPSIEPYMKLKGNPS